MRYGEAKQDGSHFEIVRVSESARELLRKAENQLLALENSNKNRAAMPLLHSSRIHVWKALEDLNAAMEEGIHE